MLLKPQLQNKPAEWFRQSPKLHLNPYLETGASCQPCISVVFFRVDFEHLDHKNNRDKLSHPFWPGTSKIFSEN
jgi:hypothetical protein